MRLSPRARRRLLLAARLVGALAVLSGLAIGALFYVTFGGIAPLVDGARVGPGVTVADGYVASFLLDAGDGTLVLIDAGQDETAAPILAALARMGKSASDVRAVLLTHGHSDHRAGLAHFPGARIHAHAGELPLLRGEVAARGPIPRLGGRMPPIEVSHVLHDADVLRIGELDIRVFHLPGHTDGSVAYLVGDTLFMGDNAHSLDSGAIEAAPWVFSDDTGVNAASLRGLPARLDAAGVRVERLVFSHSAPLEGAQALRDFAR